MTPVVDGSMALAWLFEDERTEPVLRARGQVLALGGVVPALWHLEVANGLMVAERRGRISRDFRRESLRDLGHLRLEIDPNTMAHAWNATLALAERHRLTVYDAAYLELASRRQLPLATLDRQLRAAAHASLVPLLG